MISGIFHQGSGLGNQLFRYIMTRTLAEDKGYEWMMQNEFLFKGKDFMNIEISSGPIIKIPEFNPWFEKKVVENDIDVRGYDPEINFVEDGTVIDGEFQDERYWGHKLDDIDKWLRVEPIYIADNTCVIGFRGGEYAVFPDLFLNQQYWDAVCNDIKARYLEITDFEVHTDDVVTAQKFFPNYPIIHDIGINWRSMRYAKYAIIANSSFFILPRLLSKGITFAPRYWARRNIKVWALPQNYYKEFIYV